MEGIVNFHMCCFVYFKEPNTSALLKMKTIAKILLWLIKEGEKVNYSALH